MSHSNDPTSDSALDAVGRAGRADPSRWLNEHGDAMFRYARRRLPNDALAEDAVQEALLAAISSVDRFGGRSSERTWLIGILRHKVVDLCRSEARHGGADAAGLLDGELEAVFRGDFWAGPRPAWPGAAYDSPRAGAAGTPEGDEFRRCLWVCVDTLPERARAAVLFVVADGMTARQAGEALGMSEQNVWTTVHRAYVRLRRCLEARWLSTGGKGDAPR